MLTVDRRVKSALNEPDEILPYFKKTVKRKYYAVKYARYQRKKGLPLQKHKVSKLLDNDEFVLIILDSCRFDYFEGMFEDYLSGDLEKIWSAGNRTPRWTPNLWTGSYNIDYVSGIAHPVSAASFDHKHWSFNPETTFRETVNIHSNPFTSYPTAEKVTDVALAFLQQSAEKRCVIHYAQPHRPYLGDRKILPWRVHADMLLESVSGISESDIEEYLTDTGHIFGEDIFEIGLDEGEIELLEKEQYDSRDRIKNGELTKFEIREAYKDNLDYVLDQVRRLIKYIDCPVVISADHGEHLGEYTNELPRYHHPNQTHPILREVPWCTVDENSKGTEDLDSLSVNQESIEEAKSSNTIEEIEEQLQALGYR